MQLLQNANCNLQIDGFFVNKSFMFRSTSTCNAVMEAGKKMNSPVMIQVSNGGGAYFAGKSTKDPNAAAAGAVYIIPDDTVAAVAAQTLAVGALGAAGAASFVGSAVLGKLTA